MARKNRTELDTTIASWAATLNLTTTHRPDIREIIENCVLIKDVTDTSTATTATHDIDWDGVDYHEVTLNYYPLSTITFSNINQGDIKWLKVILGTGSTFAFSGITLVSLKTESQLTLPVILMVFNKDSSVYAVPMSETVDAATDAQQQTGTATTVLSTPDSVKYVTRHGHKTLANAESYSLADGVGYISLESGVSGGTITLPTASSSYAGHKVVVYSTGGSGVVVQHITPLVASFTANYMGEFYCDGSTWIILKYKTRT